MSEVKGWGRPRGSKMSEEAKKKISESVKARYVEWKKNKLLLENEIVLGEINKNDGAEGE